MLDDSCVYCECLALTRTKESKGSVFLCSFGMVVKDFAEVEDLVEDRAMYERVVWVLD